MPLPELMSLTHFEGHLRVKKEKEKTFTDLNRRVPDHLLILPFFFFMVCFVPKIVKFYTLSLYVVEFENVVYFIYKITIVV